MKKYTMEELWASPRKKTNINPTVKKDRIKFRIKLVNGGYVCECDNGIMVVPKEHADVFTEEEANKFIFQNWLEATLIPIGRSN